LLKAINVLAARVVELQKNVDELAGRGYRGVWRTGMVYKKGCFVTYTARCGTRTWTIVSDPATTTTHGRSLRNHTARSGHDD
jgi:hypothetical protein